VTFIRCIPLAALLLALAGLLHAAPRSYLAASGGAVVLNTNLDGDVVSERVIGQLEIGVGTHLNDNLLLEATFGFLGQQEGDERFRAPSATLPPESEITFRVAVNPMMVRLRYTRTGMRTGYMKPEFEVGFGAYHVTRWLQPLPGIEAETTSRFLPALEVGFSALFILGKNFSATFGPRYTMTQRIDLVESTDHLDGLSILLGFRFFLKSARDEFEEPG
jgi:hypothetical protein